MSEAAARQVLVVSSPLKSLDELRDARAYVMECLEVGILVLSPGMGYEFVDFQPVSGVYVVGGTQDVIRGHDIPAAAAHKPPPNGRSVKVKGRDKLLAYRKSAGLGCYNTLAASLGGRMTAEVLRAAATGDETLTTEEWRRIALAVDKLQGKGAADE